MNVRDVMTKSPAVCTPDTSLEKVARLMVEHDCGAIPIVENEQGGRAVGVITDRDITVRTVAKGQNPLDKRAEDVMTRGTATVRQDEPIERAAEMMEDKQVRRLVVVDDAGKCIGILAQADIARHAPDELTGDLVEEISEPGRRAGKKDAV